MGKHSLALMRSFIFLGLRVFIFSVAGVIGVVGHSSCIGVRRWQKIRIC